MDFGRLGRGELVAAVGGLLLAGCLFAPWYQTDPSNPNARIDGRPGDFSGWDVHTALRWLLLAGAIAPLILIWIVIRDHELSWARGEMTAVVAIAAFGFVAYSGLLDRPGEPNGAISLQWGYWAALLGTILMVGGGAVAAGQTERTRKPPGVL
jgi:hypothetical protein